MENARKCNKHDIKTWLLLEEKAWVGEKMSEEKLKTQTNAEYMRTCSDEELAEIFMRFMFDADFKMRFITGNFEEEFLGWLKEKYE